MDFALLILWFIVTTTLWLCFYVVVYVVSTFIAWTIVDDLDYSRCAPLAELNRRYDD